MGRPRGSRNPDFEHTRAGLLAAVRKRLDEPDGAHASFRELAAAAGVSAATLRHYFGSREGVIEAALAHSHKLGMPYMLNVATGPLGPLRESLRWLLDQFIHGAHTTIVADVHALGLSAGLRDPKLGPAYLNEVLEPSLQAVEARLARHVAQGDLAPCDLRHAAISLIAPVLVATLHQWLLGGKGCRPLDLEAFVRDHLEAFIRAHGSEERSASS